MGKIGTIAHLDAAAKPDDQTVFLLPHAFNGRLLAAFSSLKSVRLGRLSRTLNLLRADKTRRWQAPRCLARDHY